MEGKRRTRRDGCGIGRGGLIGSRDLATFPLEQRKRVRRLWRAEGYYAQCVLQVERRVSHVSTGSALGIDVGIAAYVTDSDGHAVANPRFFRLAEARLKRYQRPATFVPPRRVPQRVPQGREEAKKQSRRPPAGTTQQVPQGASSARHPILFVHSPCAIQAFPTAPVGQLGKGEATGGRAYLHLQRQREDFARKTASALSSSHDLSALEDLQVRNLVRNRRLAKAISDVGWSRLRWWVEYYGRLQGIPVVAAPPEHTSQDCSGVLPDGSPCPTRVRPVAQHAHPHLSALWAHLGSRRERRREYSGAWRWRGSRDPGRRKRVVPWRHTGTYRLGTAGLLRWGESPAVAPAGGSRNLPDSSGQSVNLIWNSMH
jgi:putative transposase